MFDSSSDESFSEYDYTLATTAAPEVDGEAQICLETLETKIRGEVTVTLLQALLDAGSAENIGRKVLILAYQLKLDRAQTLEQLAAQFTNGGSLGVSVGRVSQIVGKAKALCTDRID
jgi:hypothetical protein